MRGLEALAAAPLFIAGVVLGLGGLAFVVLAFARLFQRRPLGFAIRLLFGSAVALAGALAVALVLGVQGYTALTREVVAARIKVTPSGAQRFDAQVS